ncbi:MAG: alpha/beta hydrolase [Betaproteobacteria bacterium]|nr:alpha/beta hydrolase [Betaproteobacteria bacterium]
MPTARIDASLEMHYLIDDYTDPWREAETILMIHGNAERGQAWYGWVPHLARHFRVVRPDTRGFGESTPMPRDFKWTIDLVIDDYLSLLKTLGIERFHLIAAKLGGTIARHFAARCPERVLTLTVAGTPPPKWDRMGAKAAHATEELEKTGVERWARKNMAGRLGSKFPPEGVEWWTKLMGKTPLSTLIVFGETIPYTDITADLPRIQCPTLVITTEKSALGSVESTRAWQQTIPNSELVVLPGDSYHVAASDADRCAEEVLKFITRRQKPTVAADER